MEKKWTGERLESFIFTRDTIDHLHRYAIASNYGEGKIVLDIASGEGYGSNILSKTAKKVYGVDIDTDTITSSKNKYKAKNIEFFVGTTSKIPLKDDSVDVVISFETIEHHEYHEEMMLEIKRVLRPDGVLIVSTPDKLEYSDKRSFVNKFHIKELYKKDFSELISKHFINYQMLSQTYINGNSIIHEIKTDTIDKVYYGSYDQIKQGEACYMYLIAIASDFEIVKQDFSVFDGSNVLQENFDVIKNKIYDSNSYRLGHFILYPFKKLKKIFR